MTNNIESTLNRIAEAIAVERGGGRRTDGYCDFCERSEYCVGRLHFHPNPQHSDDRERDSLMCAGCIAQVAADPTWKAESGVQP